MSWIEQVLERNRIRRGDRIAVIDGDRRVTYGELDDRTGRLARGLLGHGLRRGDAVALLSANRLEVWEAYFALARLGAIAVPVNPALPPAEVGRLSARCRARMVLGEAPLLARLEGAVEAPRVAFEDERYAGWLACGDGAPLPDVELGDLFAILHTSATTGEAKGVMIDQRSLMAIALGYLEEARPPDDVVLLHCCPLFHGAVVLPLVLMTAGATVAVMRAFTPQLCLAEIARLRATHVFLVPDMLRFVLQARAFAGADLSSLREVIYGAAPMPPALLAEAHERLGCGFRQLYGSTECGGPMGTLAPEDHVFDPEAPHPVGRMVWGMEAAVRDEEGRRLPPGEVGEVCIRGDGLMRGYWEDPEATREAMPDGWFRTGDLGRLDERGFVHLLGRTRDVINRGGLKVYPAEVERALLAHPGVRETAVVGVPDRDWGEVPVAYVVAAGSPPSPADLLRFTVGRLASYQRPVRVELIDELPRNPAGKILRRVLRERAAAGLEEATVAEDRGR
jgi:acyl-CoA synthetase (AMP-forming)/AMP-acid ligase II